MANKTTISAENAVKTTSKVDLAAKFAAVKAAGISSVGTKKDMLYCSEIFAGLTEKQKKTQRKKLRNNRDDFVQKMLSAKESDRKGIAICWKEFATGIYRDIFQIYETNTSTDKLNDLATFVQMVRKELAK